MRIVKIFCLLAATALLAPAARARVWVTAYRSDETTPLAVVDPNHPTVYRDIMVGTRLVLVVRSDAPGEVKVAPHKYRVWSGFLGISWDDWQRGTLAGRDYNKKEDTYDGSYLPAAGLEPATVWYREYIPDWIGFDIGTGPYSTPGDWFVFDYHAQQAGTCAVGLYDWNVDLSAPIQSLSFTQVRTRDFNGDTIVNFQDLALLTARWGATVDPNSPQAAFDLNADGRIDLGDLPLFSEYWLERTDSSPTATDPNNPARPE